MLDFGHNAIVNDCDKIPGTRKRVAFLSPYFLVVVCRGRRYLMKVS
jgi:hypothetical protein